MLDCGEKELEAKSLGTGPQQAAVEVVQGGDSEDLNCGRGDRNGAETFGKCAGQRLQGVR